ncbi:glycosyltransferase [Butyricimonas paravirosa]|uniref:glycosyltransferase n=1 Tax=Butyricimonas paravirosa TaxID=1472417 RepID=UPI002A81D5F8|nr:glycosyltransferase [Butyricimonas paravirosa]
MKFLYISTLSSERLIHQIHERTRANPGYAVQKFGRLLVKGFCVNGAEIHALSAIPVTYKFWKKRLWREKEEIEDGVRYNYVPFLNFPYFRQICLFIYVFFYVLFWGAKDRKNCCVICDVLNVSICISALCAAKIIGLRRLGIVTDIPSLMLRGGGNRTVYLRFVDKINNAYLAYFSHYVFLTDPMNELVNKHNKPYIVMEGLADVKMATKKVAIITKKEPNILMYAGGLHEKYGLKLLVEAFMRVDKRDWNLVIYGSGSFAEDIKKYAKCDRRIIYKGVVPNEVVVEAELEASLLVNPRPTYEEFIRYSFPSKNIEFMVSGTPLLTTKLPGMPTEYYEYVYLFQEETINGYQSTLENILSLSSSELLNKGQNARKFILSQKNNVIQARKILEFMNDN